MRRPYYLSFFTSGAVILGFGAFRSGATALMDAPLVVMPIVGFFLFGGSALVGLVRLQRELDGLAHQCRIYLSWASYIRRV